MRSLVANGTGVAVVDAINGCAELNDGVVWRPFKPDLGFEMAVITRAETALQAPTVAFLEMTIDRLQAHERLFDGVGR
jgi:hypothetical protein